MLDRFLSPLLLTFCFSLGVTAEDGSGNPAEPSSFLANGVTAHRGNSGESLVLRHSGVTPQKVQKLNAAGLKYAVVEEGAQYD